MRNLFIILFTSAYLSCLGQVNLNEMQSSNNLTISDNMGEFDDWIELYNSTTDSIEIGGLILKDQIDTWTIPTGNPETFLAPGNYFLLWADDQEFQGDFHTNFKLASGGEFLGLYESDGITVIDSITIPSMVADDSYLKCSGVWLQSNTPTPLFENYCITGVNENLQFNDLFSVIAINKRQLEVTILNYFEHQRILSLYSIDGGKIMEKHLNHQKSIINFGLLSSNLYVVTITDSELIYSTKIRLP